MINTELLSELLILSVSFPSEIVLDLLLVVALGFLGSFGHCVGMCGPLTVAFSLSRSPVWDSNSNGKNRWGFHLLLNLGRIASYALVGAALGGVGSVAIASGQLAGIGSSLRQGMTVVTGLLLIGFGLRQIAPDLLPKLPVLHPLQGQLHDRLSKLMMGFSMQNRWWTPVILGGFWGLIPCGFLYTGQLTAAATGNPMAGMATMLAFGLGTMPTMVGVGISASRLSANRRSQLFRLGGWVTLAIGILTLGRTDAMVDYTGHGALCLLMLALVARPLNRVWGSPLKYRRAIGVGAFFLSLAHIAHTFDHTLNWNPQAIAFMVPLHRWGLWAGVAALTLMTPAALTSFDRAQQALGQRWRQIHLLTVPALVLAAIHTITIGSHYLGGLVASGGVRVRVAIVVVLTVAVLGVRWMKGKGDGGDRLTVDG